MSSPSLTDALPLILIYFVGSKKKNRKESKIEDSKIVAEKMVGDKKRKNYIIINNKKLPCLHKKLFVDVYTTILDLDNCHYNSARNFKISSQLYHKENTF